MVFEMLRDMLVESIGCGEEEVTPRAELRDDLGLSDAELENVMDAMSGELGFRYNSEDLAQILTVSQLVRFIGTLI